MKHLFYLVFSFIFISSLYAQNGFNSESLLVTQSELKQNIYPKDSTANALVIYETGHSNVGKDDFKLHFELHRKLKILNKEGFDHATEEIWLYKNDKGRKEIVENISATVYNLNGDVIEKTELSEDDIIEEKYNDNYTIVKFTFPNVKEGSIVKYSYNFISPFMYKYKSWNFQADIPKLYSEYNTSIPGNWSYHVKLVGGRKLSESKSHLEERCLRVSNGSANCMVSKYVMKDIPAFTNESFMTAKTNYLARIEYELKTLRGFDGSIDHITKSWSDTDQEVRRETDFGRMIRKTSTAKNLIEEESLAGKSDLDKTKFIYDFVREHYNWNGKYDLFNEVSLRNPINDKSGSASEINMLLYNILVSYDIDAKPLLISTREHGFATRLYPVLSDFNYTLVHVSIGGENYILDANDKYLSFGQIPFQCLNQFGRRFNYKSGSSWYDFEPSQISSMSYRGELFLDESAQLNGHLELLASDYKAYFFKKRYFSDSENFINNLVNSKGIVSIDNVNYNEMQKSDDNVKINFDISATPEIIGDKLYLNPYIVDFFQENPFNLQERSYPVDFGYKQSYTYLAKISFGENYSVESLPETQNISLPEKSGLLTVNYQASETDVTIYFKLTFNKAIYEPAFYQSLKELMSVVIDKQKNTLIVFSKKE
ncbi:DUF3857 domain-containing protein [Psychroserpens sp. XS_ASV72]|uniref:DUF3857 domain-containing protein n=1 Tax=Psychroserpens sp. XS_ASV72 TaxID=3241293 RepID=UPI00351651DA